MKYVCFFIGDNSKIEEKSLGSKISANLSHGHQIVQLKEGSESEEFWTVLGGKEEYPKIGKYELKAIEARLFILSDVTGSFKSEEIYSFSQADLVDGDVALLDAHNEIYLWIGSGASENEKKLIIETAERYLENAKDGRNKDNVSICTVFAGRETLNFTRHFQGWDWSLSEMQVFKDPYEAMKSKYAKKEKVEEKKEHGNCLILSK